MVLGLAPLQRRGLGSEFPRAPRETARFPRSSEKIPPEFPRESILEIDNMRTSVGFFVLDGRLVFRSKRVSGVNFFGLKIPPQ